MGSEPVSGSDRENKENGLAAPELMKPEPPSRLFEFDRAFIDSLHAPYQPPPTPQSKAEALFYLSTGGRDCLGNLTRLLNAYASVLRNPGLLDDGAIAVKEPTGCASIDKDPVCSPLSALDLTTYFSGFGALGEWLSHAYTLAFGEGPLPSRQATRCLDRAWMDEFAHEAKHIDLIECLYAGLWHIIDRADRNWFVDVHWTLVLERLKRAADENDQKYANTPYQRDKNSRADRKKLLKSLIRAGLVVGVHFTQYFSEDEDETKYLEKSRYQPRITQLRRALLSKEVKSIRDVYEAFAKKLSSCESGGGTIPVLDKPLSQQNAAPILDSTSNNMTPPRDCPNANQANSSHKNVVSNSISPTSESPNDDTCNGKWTLYMSKKEFIKQVNELEEREALTRVKLDAIMKRGGVTLYKKLGRQSFCFNLAHDEFCFLTKRTVQKLTKTEDSHQP